MTAARAPQPGPYAVVPHLDLFRITGQRGSAALVTFREESMANSVCMMLTSAYEQGSRAKGEELRTALATVVHDTLGVKRR
jgi:hypothetical protein